MARRTLGFSKDVQPTVTGGLTFFGAPLNSYMTHAACAMVRRVRDGVQHGLLYGQGGFVTKHHALVLSPERPNQPLSETVSVQAIADAKRKPVPGYDDQPSGKGTVESFTVIYDRDGSAKHGVVILRTQANDRTLARVHAGAGAGRRQGDARALARPGSHADRRQRPDRQGGGWHCRVAGGLMADRCRAVKDRDELQ
jgi:acetyl-CoA C-acetyltransferase